MGIFFSTTFLTCLKFKKQPDKSQMITEKTEKLLATGETIAKFPWSIAYKKHKNAELAANDEANNTKKCS